MPFLVAMMVFEMYRELNKNKENIIKNLKEITE